MSQVMSTIFTVGHSTLTIEALQDRLAAHGVQAVADVRTSPYSQRLSWFNRESLSASLNQVDVSYVFLGDELGGRPSGRGLMGPDGRALYREMAKTTKFRQGIKRLLDGSDRMKICLLCSEQDPMKCHRALLVARQLSLEGVPVIHILGSGQTETHGEFERRLLDTTNMAPELTRSDEEILNEAYEKQSARVAYKESRTEGGDVGQ